MTAPAARLAPECGCYTTGKVVRGMCVPHYDRWVHATPPGDRPPAPRFRRSFDDFVDRSQECWLWTGPRDRKGYGFWSGGGERGLAHRLSLARTTPPPDPSLMACHQCDNPPCVNPEHLYWGTAKDNAADVMARGGVHNKGMYATHCPRGHALSGENLRIAGKAARRFCRTCDNTRARERQRRIREARRATQ